MALFQNISIDQLLSTWAANGGPSEEEKIAYANDASDMLENSKMVEEFIEHVNQFGVWARAVDESFMRITRGFGDMVSKYGGLLPDLKQNWDDYLTLSRNVASEDAKRLDVFDTFYLEMIENIKTVQDVKNAASDLQAFIDEDEDQSKRMSSIFLSLKREIEYFGHVLEFWVDYTGEELKADAKRLQQEIDSLNSQINEMDQKTLGVIVTGTVLAQYQAQRDGLAKRLNGKKDELNNVNQAQDALPHLKSAFDGFMPDISSACHTLVLIAEIWTSVSGFVAS
ncbi:hypothetical protein MD484_g8170, partial [Candolleomyces efflorescens]